MREVDAKFPAPSERAQKIHKVVKEHAPDATYWDIVCFCIEIFGALSLDPEFAPVVGDTVKKLSNQIYTIHYMHAEELLSEPNKAGADIRAKSSTDIPGSHKGRSGTVLHAEESLSSEGASGNGERQGASSDADDQSDKGSSPETTERGTSSDDERAEGD